MISYIALLRGINVGGHKLIKMNDLKEMLLKVGLQNVNTYIQSGNIVFKSVQDAEPLKFLIEQEIDKAFGFSVNVILRTATEWEEIIRKCPYQVDALQEGESIHLSLMENEPSEERLNHLFKYKNETEDCYINGKEIYLFLRKKVSDSKLSLQLQKLRVPATARNWKTVKKLETMLNELDKN
jgi:uncharacterized protein (DUF1697 family)